MFWKQCQGLSQYVLRAGPKIVSKLAHRTCLMLQQPTKIGLAQRQGEAEDAAPLKPVAGPYLTTVSLHDELTDI